MRKRLLVICWKNSFVGIDFIVIGIFVVAKCYQAVSLSMTRFDYYRSFILLGLLTCEELGASVITLVRCIYTAPIQRHSCTPSRCYFQVLLASTVNYPLDLASICFMLLILTYRQRHRLSSQSQSICRHAAHRDRDRHAVTRSCIGMAGRINAPTSLYGNERACLTLMMMTRSRSARMMSCERVWFSCCLFFLISLISFLSTFYVFSKAIAL